MTLGPVEKVHDLCITLTCKLIYIATIILLWCWRLCSISLHYHNDEFWSLTNNFISKLPTFCFQNLTYKCYFSRNGLESSSKSWIFQMHIKNLVRHLRKSVWRKQSTVKSNIDFDSYSLQRFLGSHIEKLINSLNVSITRGVFRESCQS